MSIKHIPPQRAFAMLSEGAVLIDIREKDEWLREHIPAARHVALSGIERQALNARGPVIFHCRSGNRTTVNAARLVAVADGAPAYLLEGGLEAWRDAGLPTVTDKRQPLELMRQVQIGAGALILTGVVLGAMVHPAFYGLSGFIGAGLVLAGATGFCGMARMLKLAPWNRNSNATA
jgi:rhodanese-related sulfurtransferase